MTSLKYDAMTSSKYVLKRCDVTHVCNFLLGFALFFAFFCFFLTFFFLFSVFPRIFLRIFFFFEKSWFFKGGDININFSDFDKFENIDYININDNNINDICFQELIDSILIILFILLFNVLIICCLEVKFVLFFSQLVFSDFCSFFRADVQSHLHIVILLFYSLPINNHECHSLLVQLCL